MINNPAHDLWTELSSALLHIHSTFSPQGRTFTAALWSFSCKSTLFSVPIAFATQAIFIAIINAIKQFDLMVSAIFQYLITQTESRQ